MVCKISVIVPCYNQEKYIKECLDSLVSQTFKDYEVIVIDDGSTDDSAEIVNEYVKHNKNIRLIRQANQGVVVARNNAIKQAQGTYIYPLDADDKIAPTCLERLYYIISTTNNSVVASEVWMFGKCCGFFYQPKFTKYEMYGRHECCVISALFYKEDFEKFGGYKIDFNGYSGDDMDYWLNYVDNNLPMIRLPEVLFFYRTKSQEESLWKNYFKKELRERRLYKDTLLQRYHPKMRLWAILYKFIHCKFIKIFYRNNVKNNCRRIKILGITVYKSKFIDKNIAKPFLYFCNSVVEHTPTYYIVSGGFDPIHEGHIEMIKASAQASDGVIVLVNSDKWLCRKKGKNFHSMKTRKSILENLKGVVDVLEFDDSDGSANDGIKKVRERYPEANLVFANGGDRGKENIPECSTCIECGVDLAFGVGGENKANSSSWILNKWSKVNV